MAGEGMLSLAAPPPAIFSCTVTRVHDRDGPIFCSNGTKIRVAGIQAPNQEHGALPRSPCRVHVFEHGGRTQPRHCRALGAAPNDELPAYTGSYLRIVARCTL